MGAEETALGLIGLTYEAALAPEKWRTFMERFAQALGARSAALREVDYDAGHVALFETVGYDSAYVAAYGEHFVRLDFFAPTFVSIPIGTVKTGDEIIPWEQQRNTEFSNDYLLAQNVRHLMGGILARDERRHLLFALQRERGRPDYDAEDKRLLRLLMPHMARSVQIHRRMAEVTTQKHWSLSALDHLRVGVILLDEAGRPLHLNRAAKRLTSATNGFAAGRRGLTLPSAKDTDRLRRLIADAAGLATRRNTAGGGCLHAMGNGGGRLQFQVIPLPWGLSERPLEQSLPRGCVAVFVSTSGGPRLTTDRVAAMHGLTRAEARLASLLAVGIGPQQAAEALSVSVHTVRSQLKSVFAKTGTTRQAELVALLLADMLSDQADDSSDISK